MNDKTETQKVDVLAVLNRLSAPVARESVTRYECEKVYDAVAELIEAARFFEEESRKKYGDNTTGGSTLRAAISRVGGAA